MHLPFYISHTNAVRVYGIVWLFALDIDTPANLPDLCLAEHKASRHRQFTDTRTNTHTHRIPEGEFELADFETKPLIIDRLSAAWIPQIGQVEVK